MTLLQASGLTPDAWQTRICTSPARQQLWLAHRQAGKSTTVAAKALAVACGTDGALVLLLSRTLRQSGELFRKVRMLYQASVPLPLLGSTALTLELTNGSRIVSLPGTEETIVGYSAPALVVIDEAARVPDGLYYALRPMLAMSRGQLIALSTPWGRRGWFYEAWEGMGSQEAEALDVATVNALLADLGMTVTEDALEGEAEDFRWERTCIRAPDNPRLSARFLANERRSIPDLIFRSEWLCQFVASQDAIFRYEDLEQMLSDSVAPVFQAVAGTVGVSTLVEPLFGENGH